jgi:phosphoribosyl 1,2-cyclic phosphate phosphodiesterase
MAAALMHGLRLSDLRYCLQTHEHHDHLDASHLSSRSANCGVHGNPRLRLYASIGALRRAATDLSRRLDEDALLDPAVADRLNLTAHPIEPFETFEAGPYRVTSLLAAHDPQSITALLYVVERDDRALFYCTDTGPLPEPTWQALAALDRRLNVVAMDHTFGLKGRSNGHMNAEQFREQIARLREADLLADDARVFAHHLGHHSNPAHPELVDLAAQGGYEVAYDGLTVEV